MTFVNYKINASREEVMSVMRDNNLVVAEEKYDTPKGTPKMTLKEKGSSLKIKCEYTGGATKDNGFLEGTAFRGSVVERDGVTTVKGIILTAPIYHLVVIALMVLFIVQCVRLGGINFVPIILFFFSIFMFKDEFRKQGIIKRYIFRSLKIVYRRLNGN